MPNNVIVKGSDFRLGKSPARKGAIKFAMETYLAKNQFPTPPLNFGHYALVQNYPMFSNDKYGDCVWAGAGHEHQQWNAEANRVLTFTDAQILDGYASTGFNPNDPSTDNGTDMEAAAQFRRKTGIIGSDGQPHKILAYLAPRKFNDLNALMSACYLFGAVGVGIKFPGSAMDQFNAGKPWDVVPRAKIEGGHYIPVLGRQNGMLVCVTWGRIQLMTQAFFKKYCDETIIYLTDECFVGGNSPEGFNLDALKKDLASLN